MKRWLFKTEPSDYSFEDLQRDRRTVWSGVSNALALIHLRAASPGDEVLIYHTGGERRVVGRARILKGPYPDPGSKNAKLVVVDIAAGDPLARPVGLDEMKSDPVFEGFDLIRLGRLSIVPVPDACWKEIIALSMK